MRIKSGSGARLVIRHSLTFAVVIAAVGSMAAMPARSASAAGTAPASALDRNAAADTTAATAEPLRAPPPPVVSTSSFTGGTIEVTWEDPPPSALITEYKFRYKTGPGRSWSDWATLPATARSLTLTGLAEDAQHHVMIWAFNSAGSNLTFFSLGEVSVPQAPYRWFEHQFSDDDGNVHVEAIEAIAAASITLGCGPRLYCPAEEVTRGQFASMMVRAFPDQVPDDADDFFSDDDGTTHEGAINRLASAAVVDACAPDRFCPGDPLTRAQMATMLARALPGLAPPTQDHFSDDDGAAAETAINALAANGIISGCEPGRFCPDDPVKRDQTATLLAKALNLDLNSSRPSPWRLETVIDRIDRIRDSRPTNLQAPVGDDRLFLTTLVGMVYVIADGAILPEPFLDLRPIVLLGREEGLLGLAFHPDYGANRKFYVFYTDLDGHNQVYEYRTDPDDPNRADPSTARQIITFEQECPQHNGGQLQFGPDGYLYISIGDGGCGWDQERPRWLNGQNPHTLLATIVRIDVDNGDPYAIPADNPFADGRKGRPEVWAYGLRNPWRFSFDSPNIYIADVGGNHWEEVNIADASQGGINYGWAIREGTDCRSLLGDCEAPGLFDPQIDYSHTEGGAVIGGYVYRGSAIPEMIGRYFYSDWIGKWVRTFAYVNGEVTEHYDWSRVVEMPFSGVWSFGKDGHGELYMLADGSVYKIVPR